MFVPDKKIILLVLATCLIQFTLCDDKKGPKVTETVSNGNFFYYRL